jgi:hypothetical protein
MLELMGKIERITDNYEQNLRNLTDEELNSIDETKLDELILEDNSEQEKRFLELIQKTTN